MKFPILSFSYSDMDVSGGREFLNTLKHSFPYRRIVMPRSEYIARLVFLAMGVV